MPTFTVFKGNESGAPKKETTTRPDELSGDEVFVRITASGLCGTDLHYRKAHIGLGHEGVGVVEKTGPLCKALKAGDRVGWGYNHSFCGRCAQCLSGNDIFCTERAMYGFADLDQGSFGSHAVWREVALFKIPENMSDEDAAPLQCAGATVFSALHTYRAQPTETVGVMGVGGLGHLAIQFASKMGCRVIVLSGSESKKDEAMKLGAHEFLATKGKTDLKVSHPIDRLLVTTSFQPNWEQLLPILAPGATIYPLSVSEGNFEIPNNPMLVNGITVQGSCVASRLTHERMLEFAALHQIKPVVQFFDMTEEGILDAMDKLDSGKVHFRAVLKPVA
ncbi:GroES-like protein [Xylaria bambusicola]|uniref:GroES-like protein n=1 Tax=Xylaria bambusicola TaxID=326684 RepID=UPI0020075060|nr:GroES-like protein [Xylaria bambusicola]KAI0508466.1 GroES-like protein [Xylaria bambusicola]